MNTEEDEFNRIEREAAMRKEAVSAALNKKAENARELGLDYEPVWGGGLTNKDYEDAMRLRRLNELSKPAQPMHPEIKKMYEDYFDKCFRESSPAQRPWVGLTDGERNGLWRVIVGWGDPSHDDVDLMKAIEDALRKKNEM